MAESKSAVSLDHLDAPPEIRAAIAQLRDDLTGMAGTNLAGLILYGGVARGRYRPGKSDINLVVLLNDTQATALGVIAPLLRTAWRAWRVEPFILKPSEVARLSVTFPTKLLDIARHHIVLFGTDPFADVQVSREQVRLRIEQSLRNSELRLRRRYIAIFDDAPSEATSASVLRAAAERFDLDREPLARIAALRREANKADDLPALYDRVLAVIARAAEIVSTME